MASVAEELRRESRAAVQRLGVGDRIDLALRLGEDDLEAYRAARGLERQEAIRELQRRRQRGRRTSSCIQALLA